MPSKQDGLRHMAEGLAFIHLNKFTLRDISPDNILISLDGDRLIISDFGLCKPVNDPGTFTISQLVGKHKWWAPELFQWTPGHNQRGTIQSDTFAMGCVFHYYLTKGKHPFEVADDPERTRQNIINGATHKRKIVLIKFFFVIITSVIVFICFT